MVMRRSDSKRIAKDVSVTLEDNPKRTKVHAQRKFAQGSGMNSPVMTPIKDKEKAKVNGASSSPELLPSKRPKTEDFLTFLCFRGTEVLPSRLDFFNSASKSPKQEKDGSIPGSSKQASVSPQENKAKKTKNKLNNAKVVHSLKTKLLEKRLGTRSTRLAQKTVSTIHARPRHLIEERQKKVGNVVVKKQLVRGRPAHHPSILKRLGATRSRAGLRSGGQLPPGSDVGIKSDRKPRKKLMRVKANKSMKGALSRTNMSRKKNERVESEDEEVDDEEDDYVDEDDKKKHDSVQEKKEERGNKEGSSTKEVGNEEAASKRSPRISTRSRGSSASPALPPTSLGVSSRPSRKTKEAATLYMEMLTKDLRSPEEEEDEEFGKVSTGSSPTLKKRDGSSESMRGNIKKTKQIKIIEQSTSKGKPGIKGKLQEVSIMTRANRKGQMKAKESEDLRSKIRTLRGNKDLQHLARGGISKRRGRGRPPLSRAPPVRRGLRNVRKVTNFAEEESETENEEDEMLVETLLSDEMERLESGPGRLKPARGSTSVTKSSKRDLKSEIKDEQYQDPVVEEKSLNKRKTRGSLNSSVRKSIDVSSEEDSRRCTRARKEKDIGKERKPSSTARRNRLDNSESEEEENDKPSPRRRRSRPGNSESDKEDVDKERKCSSIRRRNRRDNSESDKEDVRKERKLTSTRSRNRPGNSESEKEDGKDRKPSLTARRNRLDNSDSEKEDACKERKPSLSTRRNRQENPDSEKEDVNDERKPSLTRRRTTRRSRADNSESDKDDVEKERKPSLKSRRSRTDNSGSEKEDVNKGLKPSSTIKRSRPDNSESDKEDTVKDLKSNTVTRSRSDNSGSDEEDNSKHGKPSSTKSNLDNSEADKEGVDKSSLTGRRRSRPDNSSSDTERNNGAPKEKPPAKRGRRSSSDKSKEVPDNEKQPSASTAETSTMEKEISIPDAEEIGDSSLKVPRNQSDQSVAYVLLSLAEVKGWGQPEIDCHPSKGEDVGLSTRYTRSCLKEVPKEESKLRRGKKRNPSVETGAVTENTEEKIVTISKRNKRESVAPDTSQKGRTRSSKTRSLGADEPASNFNSKIGNSEEMILKKLSREEHSSFENKVQDGSVTSDSEEDKSCLRLTNIKSSGVDKVSISPPTRIEREKMIPTRDHGTSDSDVDLKLAIDSLDAIGKKETKSRRKSSAIKKEDGASAETSDNDLKHAVKYSQYLSEEDFLNFNNLETTNEGNNTCLESKNIKCDKGNLLIKDEGDYKNPNILTGEGKRQPVTLRKNSADSRTSHSRTVDTTKSHDKKNIKGKTKSLVTEMQVGSSKEVSALSAIKKNLSASNIKMQNRRNKDDTSSSDSDEDIRTKSSKQLIENKGTLGPRKRFPRRSRVDYFPNIPKRTLHTRKVKSVNERYVDEDSFSSDVSSTSEESHIIALRSQKRIKPKNSTQNDAIESAIREAVLKQEKKEELVTHLAPKMASSLEKTIVNLPSKEPDIKLRKENVQVTSQIPSSNSSNNPLTSGENKTRDLVVGGTGVDTEKATYVAGQSSDENIAARSAVFTKLSHDNTNYKLEQVSKSSSSPNKTNLFNIGSDITIKKANLDSENKKQSMSETWRQAFKNAKIPKPGQSSPVPHGVKPFVRKPFSTGSLGTKPNDALKGVNPNISKVSNTIPQFKSSTPFQTLGKYSPNRVFPNGEDSSKSHSPSRRPPEVRDSPSKSSVSSSDDSRALSSESKKATDPPVKSLTQLQYEKRSSDLISSLKEAPIIIDPAYPVAPFTSKLKEAVIETAPQRATNQNSPSPMKPTAEGKHLNLPAVEHTLRKMSPITVSKKPLINKNIAQLDKKATSSVLTDKQKETSDEAKDDSIKSGSQIEETTAPRTSNIEILGKKKVNMTTEEIKRWLDDSTSSGIEHSKGCGIFEKNECECSYRTTGASMMVGRGDTIGESSSEIVDNRTVVSSCQQNMSNTGSEIKVDRGFVEPPVQLRELAEIATKYGGEIISTCKVEDYRERVLSKNKEVTQKITRRQSTGLKSDRSMTEEEMCEFDFRFDRNSNSPRESGSEMSSPPPLRDDISEKSDLQHFSPSERKPIFQQRRSCGTTLKRPPQSKSPAAAFSAENELSVYAFEPEEPPVSLLDKPFRRRSSKGTRDDETSPVAGQQPPSSSIAVQVNLESEAVLETEAVLECCTTQTDHSQDDEENGGGGRSFYIPIEQSTSQLIPQQTIKGVTLKVESEGPNNQRVMLRAKLVTKPPTTFATPSTSHRSLVDGNTESGGNSGGGRRRPEQKVRPLSARAPPPVGTVQPTLREAAEQNVTGSSTKLDKPTQASQGTQSSPRSVSTNSVTPNIAETAEPIVKGKSNVGGNQHYEDGSIHQRAPNESATMLEAPTFYPTEKEFGDPLEYIEKITPLAQHLGICRIVPPPSFKPECKVSDDMRFTAYNQYIHKMLHRWGPNVREMSAIRKYLATQNIALNQPPWIGGMEVDLPRLYQTVQQCGGLKEVYEKKRWTKVADVMKIPRSAQDRVTKLDDIYCKFLLPYDTLSHGERSKLLEDVELEWREREKRMMEKDDEIDKEEGSDNDSDSDERDECITKGKSVALSGFYRIARNTMSMWFSKDSTPGPVEVENEFWRHVTNGTAHVCVHSGSIDTATWGCGFPTGKERSSARHPWNLKILTNNPRSILRSLGPLIGVTVPTLHVGMLFSACCWYRDPHALPWIEYLHTGANKIWYGVPDSWSEELQIAVKRLMPRYCREKKKIWLASDTVMVPPQLLVTHGVSVCRTVQEPGHFVVVFPRAFTSSLCTGYLVSESVYFAHPSWIDTSRSVFKDIQDSCEPPIFSLEKLLFNIATDIRSSGDVLTQILPLVIELKNEEVTRRKILEGFGLVADEKLPVTKGRRTKSQEEPNEYECDICRGNLFLSLVTNTQDEINYCLVHAIEIISKDKDVLKQCKLMYAYDEEEMEELIEKIKTKIEIKNQKKQGKCGSSSSSKT